MKKCTLILAGLLCAFMLASPVGAQDLPTATKHKNVKWYTVRYTKFKPGKADEAQKIIYNHFWKIDVERGRKVMPFTVVAGDWDHVVYFPMDGPGELAWATTPSNEEWFAQLVEQEGGIEQARALQEKYRSLIAEQKTEIVRAPVPGRGARLGEVLALREFTLKDGADADAYEQYVAEEVNPAWDKHVPGLHGVTMKGDRGERDGHYIGAWVFDTLERRNHYFPTPDAPAPDDGPAYPVFAEAYAPMQPIAAKFSDYANDPESYTDYVLVGAETVDAMPSCEVIGIHTLKVKRGMEHDFEAFVTHHLNTAGRANGLHTFVYKGDRGTNKGNYIWVAAFDPGYMRDAYFPGAQASKAWQEANAPFAELNQRFASYLDEGPGQGSTFTDYVVVR